MLDRPVVDMTELKDTFDINLEWMPDDREGSGPLGGARVLRAAPAASPSAVRRGLR